MSLFGVKLREMRVSRARSIAWLAIRVGVSKSYLRDVEHGKGVAPTMALVLDCARELHAQPFALLTSAIADCGMAALLGKTEPHVRTLATLVETWGALDVNALNAIERIAERFRR